MQYYLRDDVFERIYGFLRAESGIHAGDKAKIRRFVEAIYWMARSGAQWRFLPSDYGKWNTVYRRYADWSDRGIWRRLFHYVSRDPDMEWLMIDSTIVRSHACSSGAKGGLKYRRSGVPRVD